MFQKRIPKVVLCCLLIIHFPVAGYTEGLHSQDQTSTRTNTLFDDADDIQRQLDNEARDRIKFGRKRSVECEEDDDDAETTTACPDLEWDYPSQGLWPNKFPGCGGRSQSPVNLPIIGLIKPRGARKLLFQNHDAAATTMTLMLYNNQIILFGEWKKENRPLIYGGAAHSRRYLFHSLVLHLPAEHTVGHLYYPLETQVFYVSAEYKDMDEALKATNDQQAILAISNIFVYGNHSHQGVADILDAARVQSCVNGTLKGNSLDYFNPPFEEYACYQGSLPKPPCTESVLWLIRGRTMHITRETWETAQAYMAQNAESKPNFRMTQPLNDRGVFYFK